MSQAEKEAISVLTAAIGKKYILTDQKSVEFYSMDVYRSFETPIAVVQPGSVEELQEVVRVASGLGIAIVTRGGGASYTDGYLVTCLLYTSPSPRD